METTDESAICTPAEACRMLEITYPTLQSLLLRGIVSPETVYTEVSGRKKFYVERLKADIEKSGWQPRKKKSKALDSYKEASDDEDETSGEFLDRAADALGRTGDDSESQEDNDDADDNDEETDKEATGDDQEHTDLSVSEALAKVKKHAWKRAKHAYRTALLKAIDQVQEAQGPQEFELALLRDYVLVDGMFEGIRPKDESSG